MEKKLEIVYYEMVKMEKRLTEKADIILKARDDIDTSLKKFEILQRSILEKLEKLEKEY